MGTDPSVQGRQTIASCWRWASLSLVPGTAAFALLACGGLTPDEIPARGCGTTVTDRTTDDVARKVSAVFFARTGRYPHVVINRLARSIVLRPESRVGPK